MFNKNENEKECSISCYLTSDLNPRVLIFVFYHTTLKDLFTNIKHTCCQPVTLILVI